MKTWKKILLAALLLTGVLIIFLFWYKWRYSMDVVKTYEINDPALAQRVLIATQGSDFKNEVVNKTIEGFRSKAVHIKVVDVSLLPSVRADEWTAIVILHTWEYQKPPTEVSDFIDHSASADKLVVLSTSGSGDERMIKVDGISSASTHSEVDDITAWIISRVNKVLDRDSL